MAETGYTYKYAFPISTSNILSEKILNEENITGIIKNICGRDKFIIGTYDIGGVTYIKFILDGYYFEIEKPVTTKYASITYTASSEIGKTFSTLNISDTSGDLQLTDENGNIIESNKIRFNFDQVELPNNISCGTV